MSDDNFDQIFEKLTEGVSPSVMSEISSRWDTLKRLINQNKDRECSCEVMQNTQNGRIYHIKRTCPVHKGGYLNELQSCPCHREDYKCVWHPESVTCGDVPCSNTGLSDREIGNNIRAERRPFDKSRF